MKGFLNRFLENKSELLKLDMIASLLGSAPQTVLQKMTVAIEKKKLQATIAVQMLEHIYSATIMSQDILHSPCKTHI